MPASMKAHWDAIYSSRPVPQLSWHEPVPKPSLQLIERANIDKKDAVLDVGSGTSTLINALLEQGYQRLFALDISEIALEKARTELGPQKAFRVHWIRDDVTHPSKSFRLPEIALWHDRAVLHFFTDDRQRRSYLSTLQRVLRPGGFVIIAAFAIGGATECSELNIRNYDKDSLIQFLGPDFGLVQSMDHIYQMPSGDLRPYVYTLFQRKIMPSD